MSRTIVQLRTEKTDCSHGGTSARHEILKRMIPTTFLELRQQAARRGPVRLAIAGAENGTAREAARAAEAAGLIQLVVADAAAGDECKAVVELAAEGACDVVMKGSVRSDQLLRAILD